MSVRTALLAAGTLLLAGCSGAPAAGPAATSSAGSGAPSASGATATGTTSGAASPATAAAGGLPFTVTAVGEPFDEPWAMTFLPDGAALVTERGGALLRVDVATGERHRVDGTPDVHHEGQGGLGDVVLGPRFATDRTVYLSYAEPGEGTTSGAAVARARLSDDGTRLEGVHVVWRQAPKVEGSGHYGHRLAVAPDGTHLFVSSGERQKLDPAQDDAVTLGKVVRIGLDGEEPTVWTKGHRNPLGLAFDDAGRLWETEMGPKGGDEVNLLVRGGNHGWPRVCNGSHYDGRDIPDHAPGDGFVPPKAWWNPSISPGSLAIYRGAAFPAWRGDALVGALSGQALIRVDLDGERATTADRWDLGTRVREVEPGPDGRVWLLADAPDGRLLRLDPR